MTIPKHALKPMDWDLKALRVFVLISRLGSLTKAGIELGLSQPAISRYLANLEKQCNGYLFQRHGRGMTLSELGHSIMPKVEQMLENADDLGGLVQAESRHIAGLVRIGTLPSLTKNLLVPLFFRLKKEYPGIRLQIQEGSGGQIDKWLLTQQIDIGLPYRNNREAEIADGSLLEMDSFLIGPMGDKVTGGATVQFCKLNQLPLVLPSKPSAVRLKLDELARKEKIELNVILDADSGLMQKTVAQLQGGYTVLPWHAVKDEVESQQLQASRIMDPVVKRTIELVVGNSPTKATRVVSRLIRIIWDTGNIGG